MRNSMNEYFENARVETYEHIELVRKLIGDIIVELIKRQAIHDKTKLKSPEVEIFDKYTPLLSSISYDSVAYNKVKKEMNTALVHHYANNRHHPEHYKNGIRDMSLVDLIEMLCDWKASSVRQNNGNILKSIDSNQIRFEYSDDLKQILRNTLTFLEGADGQL